jgi:hypothetical protein
MEVFANLICCFVLHRIGGRLPAPPPNADAAIVHSMPALICALANIKRLLSAAVLHNRTL